MNNAATGRSSSVASGKDTDSKILEAAAILFADKGFRGSTMRDIATLAGINEVTIYRHFSKKQDLCWRAVDWKIRKTCIVEALVSPLTKLDAPRVLLERFCMAALCIAREEPSLARLLYFTGLELDRHEQKSIYLNHFKPVFLALIIRLQSWIKSGEIRTIDPETAAIGIVGVLLSQLQLRELVDPAFSSGKSVETLSSEYADLCLSGLRKDREALAD